MRYNLSSAFRYPTALHFQVPRQQPLVLLVRTVLRCIWYEWSIGGMVLTGENWSAGRETLYSVGDRWMNGYGALVEWYWQGKTEKTRRKKPVTVALCPSQTSHGPALGSNSGFRGDRPYPKLGNKRLLSEHVQLNHSYRYIISRTASLYKNE
jgi:hypothetical protein